MKAGLDWKWGSLRGGAWFKNGHSKAGHLGPSRGRGIRPVTILKYPPALLNCSHLWRFLAPMKSWRYLQEDTVLKDHRDICKVEGWRQDTTNVYAIYLLRLNGCLLREKCLCIQHCCANLWAHMILISIQNPTKPGPSFAVVNISQCIVNIKTC